MKVVVKHGYPFSPRYIVTLTGHSCETHSLLIHCFYNFQCPTASATKYQTDIPMLPFLAEDLTKLIKGLLKCFVKEEDMESTAARISQMDVSDKTTWVAHNEVDIGIGADLALKALRKSGSISDLRVMEFKQDCLQSLSSMCKRF